MGAHELNLSALVKVNWGSLSGCLVLRVEDEVRAKP